MPKEGKDRPGQAINRGLDSRKYRTGNRSDIARNVYAAVQAMDQASADVESNETLAQVGSASIEPFEHLC